ncbi:MAG: hypothetical protein R3F20_15590 [Planctomycetota bacterium]
MKFLLAIGLLAASISAQVTPIALVGTAQSVPDPYFTMNPPGAARLSVHYCASGATAGLNFTISGLPLGYNTGPAATQESILLAIDVGAAATPGAAVLGGQIYLPFTPSLFIANLGPSVYLGPGDVVPCPGLIVFPGAPGPFSPNGKSLNLGLPAGIVGTFSVQGAVFDPALARLFTSNAYTFSIP